MKELILNSGRIWKDSYWLQGGSGSDPYLARFLQGTLRVSLKCALNPALLLAGR